MTKLLINFLIILITVSSLMKAKYALISKSHNQNDLYNTNKNMNHAKQQQFILLYRISDDRSVFIVNKSNSFEFSQLEYLDSIETFQSKDLTFVEDESSLNNKSQIPNEFNLLYFKNEYMLIGNKDFLYNISLNEDKFQINMEINWFSKEEKIKFSRLSNLKDCKITKHRYQNPYECANYIKASIPFKSYDDLLVVCGTNSNSPYCRKYLKIESDTHNFSYSYNQQSIFSFPQLISTKKITNSLSIQSEDIISNNQPPPPFNYLDSIYFFHSYSHIQDIYKQNVNLVNLNKTNSKSENDIQFLDVIKTPLGAIKDPNFRSSFGYRDKVYFFFSETETSDFNNGVSFKTPFSLVGQICANDKGRASFSELNNPKFLTFKKAIINCYIPEYKELIHIKYTEIQQATNPISIGLPDQENDIIYAIFNLRRANNIDSALCMYKLSNIENTMKGLFKNNPDKTKPTKPLESCDDYLNLKNIELDSYYRDICRYNKFQMEQTLNQKALFALNNVKFSSIAVDKRESQKIEDHVIFIGLNNGRLIKLIIKSVENGNNGGIQQQHYQPIIIGEYQLFEHKISINNLILFGNLNSKRIVAISTNQIKSVPLDLSCNSYDSCQKCFNSQDPYCKWSSASLKCVSATQGYNESDSICIMAKQASLSSSEIKENDLVYSIDQSLKQTENSQDDLRIYYNKIENLTNKTLTSNYSGIIILTILLTALFTSIISISLTWFLINKRLKKNAGSSSNSSHNASSFIDQDSIGNKYLNIFKVNKLLDLYNSSKNEKKNSKHNVKNDHLKEQKSKLNCYESSSSNSYCNNIEQIKQSKHKSNNLKPVTVLCNSRHDSSTISHGASPITTASSSLIVSSNTNSPNNINKDAENSSLDDESSSTSSSSASKYFNQILKQNYNTSKLKHCEIDGTNVNCNLLINGRINEQN